MTVNKVLIGFFSILGAIVLFLSYAPLQTGKYVFMWQIYVLDNTIEFPKNYSGHWIVWDDKGNELSAYDYVGGVLQNGPVPFTHTESFIDGSIHFRLKTNFPPHECSGAYQRVEVKVDRKIGADPYGGTSGYLEVGSSSSTSIELHNIFKQQAFHLAGSRARKFWPDEVELETKINYTLYNKSGKLVVSDKINKSHKIKKSQAVEITLEYVPAPAPHKGVLGYSRMPDGRVISIYHYAKGKMHGGEGVYIPRLSIDRLSEFGLKSP